MNNTFLRIAATPQLIANYRTNNVRQRLREQNVELDYHYVDKNGDFIFEQPISPKDFLILAR